MLNNCRKNVEMQICTKHMYLTEKIFLQSNTYVWRHISEIDMYLGKPMQVYIFAQWPPAIIYARRTNTRKHIC